MAHPAEQDSHWAVSPRENSLSAHLVQGVAAAASKPHIGMQVVQVAAVEEVQVLHPSAQSEHEVKVLLLRLN